MRKLFKFFPALSISLLPISAYAVCPVCVVAVGAGMGLSRKLGVDDTITGVWIGGLTLSIVMWNINWFKKKNIKFPGRNILTFLFYYVLIAVSLRWADLLGTGAKKFAGLDKVVAGVISGTLFFAFGNYYYEYLKNKNNGHAQFPFQKVVVPVTSLIFISIVFYILTK